ncbi:hypothetical protein PENSPDRAFT_281103 [Peniophora sp. CONT]|nr:hypothetical protein PENSPDRAFT_281103 [Peniophora sp. CONT]
MEGDRTDSSGTNAWVSFADHRLSAANAIYSRSPAVQVTQARTLIHREIEDASVAILKMRHCLNNLVPIVTLPPELLCRIFMSVSEDGSLSRYKYSRGLSSSWLSVTHVCRVWRSVALNCAQLWTTMPINISRKWTQAFLLRSKAAPINVAETCSHHSRVRPWLFSLIEDNMSRVSMLELEGAPSNLQELVNLFTGHTSALRKLAINHTDIWERVHIGDDITAQHAPLLRDLSLTNISMVWSDVPWSNLRSLFITRLLHPPATTRLHDFLAALSTATLLQELHVGLEKCPFQPWDETYDVHLPGLRSFSIEGYAADCQAIITSLHIPISSSIAMHIKKEMKDPRQDIQIMALVPLLAAHSGFGHTSTLVHLAKAIRLTSNWSLNWAKLVLWQESGTLDELNTRQPHISIFLEGDYTPGMRHGVSSTLRRVLDDLLTLCRNVNVTALRNIIVDFSETPVSWDQSVWCELFAMAQAVDTANVTGPCGHPFLMALSSSPNVDSVGQAPDDNVQGSVPSQEPASRSCGNTIFFPKLHTLYLAEYEDDEDNAGDTDYLEDMVARRMRIAPFAHLWLVRSSVRRKIVEQIEEIDALEVNWDGNRHAYPLRPY